MGCFSDQADMYGVFEEFLKKVVTDPAVGPKLRKSKLKIRFVFRDPDGCIYLNFADSAPEGAYGTYEMGDAARPVDVTMEQTAELANRFWQGKQNAVIAVATGKIKASGKVQKALKLVTAVRPTFRVYKQVLEDTGHADLIVS